MEVGNLKFKFLFKIWDIQIPLTTILEISSDKVNNEQHNIVH